MTPDSTSRRRFLLGALVATATACGAAITETGSTQVPAPNPTGAANPETGSTNPAGTIGSVLPPSTNATTAPTTIAPPPPPPPSTASTPTTALQKSAPTSTQPAPTSSTAPPSPASFVDHAPGAGSQIALTFHTNGDLSLAQSLLDIVSSRATPITCFVIGNWLEQNTAWARKLTDAGAELANHTYSHPDFTALSAAAMASEITRCRDVLNRITGSAGTFFRPSGINDGTASPGSTILAAAGVAGYPVVLGFDLDPYDYRDPGADTVRQRVKDNLGGGKIVSLHFGHPGTIEALPGILDDIKAAGLTPVTAGQLLNR